MSQGVQNKSFAAKCLYTLCESIPRVYESDFAQTISGEAHRAVPQPSVLCTSSAQTVLNHVSDLVRLFGQISNHVIRRSRSSTNNSQYYMPRNILRIAHVTRVILRLILSNSLRPISSNSFGLIMVPQADIRHQPQIKLCWIYNPLLQPTIQKTEQFNQNHSSHLSSVFHLTFHLCENSENLTIRQGRALRDL